MVGVVEFDYPDYTRLTLADIPGLIDGAHDNVGLGHSFLKHIERTKVLIYVLDMAGTDGRDPVEDFRHLQNELELYQAHLTERPSLIAANKMDAPEAEENLRKLAAAVAGRYRIVPVTAAIGELGELKTLFKELVQKA